MSLMVRKRRGESDEALIRRFIKKQRNTKLMDEIKDPVHGCPSCRKISKKSLKAKYKKEQAERRRKSEARRLEKKRLKRQARMNSARNKRNVRTTYNKR